MRHVQQAGGLVVNNRGEVLVIKNDIGRFTFPKGSQEEGEKLIDTARREIQEETGLKRFEIHQELGILIRPGFTSSNTAEPSLIKHIHLYFCTTDEMHLQPEMPDVVEAHWIKPDALPDILSWREELDFFKEQRGRLGL